MRKFLPFIIILSLLVPFIPSFSFTVFADDSVSDDSAYIEWKKDNVGAISSGLAENGIVISGDYFSDDYYYVDPEDNFWRDVLRQWGIDGTDYGKPLARVAYDYAIENDISNTEIYNDCFDSVLNYANSNLPYHVYRTMPISTFFQFFSFTRPDADGLRELQNFKNWVVPMVNSLDGISVLYVDHYIMASDTRIIHIGSLLDSFSFALSSGSFGNFPNLDYQTVVYNGGPENQIPNPRMGTFNLYSNSDYLPYDGYYTNYNPWAGSVSNNTTANFCYVGGVQDGKYASWHCFFSGSLYLTPDSLGSISFPVFNSSTDMQLFFTGRSNVYKFDKTVDLGQYGEDINYSELYDIISSSIQGNTDNVLDSINNVANNFLQQQIDLLHDINNALNDGSGQSWLRRIYGILDYNFPLTLTAFNDLIHAVENISVSGGSGDFSEATQVLHDIDTKLGILIDEPFTDLSDDDWNSMKSRVQTKFPFCIFSDIVAISVILNRPPQQPDLNFPIPIMGTESENMVHIDLSPYEHARPYVHGVLIFVFIIGLLALSVKIFDHLKS